MRMVSVGAFLGAVVAILAVSLVHGGDRTASPPPLGPTSDPGAFMTRVVRLVAQNRYDRAWASLHPLHQRAARRSEYVRCELLTPIPGRVKSIDVLRVTDKRVRLAGGGTVAGKAITIRLTLSAGPSLGSEIVHTVHAVAVGGRWAWILSPERFGEYRANRCAGAPQPEPPSL